MPHPPCKNSYFKLCVLAGFKIMFGLSNRNSFPNENRFQNKMCTGLCVVDKVQRVEEFIKRLLAPNKKHIQTYQFCSKYYKEAEAESADSCEVFSFAACLSAILNECLRMQISLTDYKTNEAKLKSEFMFRKPKKTKFDCCF